MATIFSTPLPDLGFPGLKPGDPLVLMRTPLAGSTSSCGRLMRLLWLSVRSPTSNASQRTWLDTAPIFPSLKSGSAISAFNLNADPTCDRKLVVSKCGLSVVRIFEIASSAI
jgi:hypothetical protein